MSSPSLMSRFLAEHTIQIEFNNVQTRLEYKYNYPKRDREMAWYKELNCRKNKGNYIVKTLHIRSMKYSLNEAYHQRTFYRTISKEE